jgi:N-methylhydantoinase A/oxoprolinase/acetone carboxylase beta subunit
MIRVGVDVGGTFTDFIMMDDETDAIGSYKIPTTPADPSVGVVNGLKEFCKHDGFKPSDVDLFFHSTTIVTNILVEHKGARTGLITTKGFRDIITIARHKKPLNFSIQQNIPWQSYPLVQRRNRHAVEQRITPPKGEILVPLNEHQVREAARELKRAGVQAVAICFLHSYLNPVHEDKAKEIVTQEFPEAFVTTSHEVVNQYREFERFNTTCLNSYVGPKTSAYIDHLDEELRKLGVRTTVHLMQSNGGTITPKFGRIKPISLAKSGPSAGLAAGVYWAELCDVDNLITFDMGGTTTLVGVAPGREMQFEHLLDTRIEGYQAMIPCVDVETVGNGGGSISWVDRAGAFWVGPMSPGADPGPACYGKGCTDPTTTDAYVLLGLIDPNYFLGGRIKLSPSLAEKVFEKKICSSLGNDVESAALGTYELATHSIVRAVELNSVRRGYDPREFTLFGFGGAGPMHAARVAMELQIPQVIIPPLPGITSAGGLLATDIAYEETRTEIIVASEQSVEKLEGGFRELEYEGKKKLTEDRLPTNRQVLRRFVEARYVGQGYELKIPFPPGKVTKNSIKKMIKDFNQAHQRQYLRSYDKQVEIVNIRVTAIGKMPRPTWKKMMKGTSRVPESAVKGDANILFQENGSGIKVATPRYDRDLLEANNKIIGPAIVEQIDSTTLIPGGMIASVDQYGNILIGRSH